MAPRQQPTQLDEISEAIGRLKGSLEGIEKYIHAERHGVNNLAQKVDALGVKITSDIASVEARIDVKIQAMDDRLMVVETAHHRQQGATGALTAILKSPAIGWLVGAAITAWAILTGKVHLP